MPPHQTPCSHTLADSFSLFALFSTPVSFVFSSLRTLCAKHPGVWGTSATSPRPPRLPVLQAGLCVIICRYLVARLFSSAYKSLLVAHRFATFSVFMHLQIPFSATSLYSHLYKTPGCGIQIMV